MGKFSPLSILGPLVGMAGSLITGNKEQDAINAEAAKKLALAKPGLDAQKFGLGQLQKGAMRYLAPLLGKDSSLLRGQHEVNVGNIEREGERAGAESTFAYGGNQRRAAGEKFRIGLSTQRAKNEENLGYGGAQEGYKRGNTSSFLQIMDSLAGQGGQSLALAGGAADMRAGAASAKYGNIQDILGMGTGFALERLFRPKVKKPIPNR